MFFLSLPQVFRPYYQSIWGPGLCRQLSATSVAMRRVSLCAGTVTAGASAPWTTRSVIAPSRIWGLWKPVCWTFEIPGMWPTKTLRSQVSAFFLHYFNDCDPPTSNKLDPIVRGGWAKKTREQLHAIHVIGIYQYTEEQFLKKPFANLHTNNREEPHAY